MADGPADSAVLPHRSPPRGSRKKGDREGGRNAAPSAGEARLTHRIALEPLDDNEWLALRQALDGPIRSQAKAGHLLGRFLLAEIVNTALVSLSLDELLERLIAVAAATLDAERGTIFLYDQALDELFSRVAQGGEVAEIRIPRSSGIAGAVFESGRPEIVHEPYSDPRFNPSVDQSTGYHTTSLICVPLLDRAGTVGGVVEVLNKRGRRFDRADLVLLEAIAGQAASALAHARAFEDERRERLQGQRLLEMTEALSVELDLDRLLAKIVGATTELLNAERATLFIHDPATDELWSRVTGGDGVAEIRVPDGTGIAGASFRWAEALVVADAYADPRFNPSIDAQTGFRTRNLLCVPIVDQHGVATGVIEVLNKRAGQFTLADQRRVQAFGAQIAIALQNAQLFTDVLSLKSYTESILHSLSDGVITLDRRHGIVGINEAARKILCLPAEGRLAGTAEESWGEANPWLKEALAYVAGTGGTDHRVDVAFRLENGQVADVNVTTSGLRDASGALTGMTLVLQDISREKSVRATMTRYIAKEFAERILSAGPEAAKGSVQVATILFSDIRRFTTISEALTPQATVAMLNEYFAEMADLVQQCGGAVDKYIGDAVMAVFGASTAGPDDADGGVRAAIAMIRRLRELNLRRAGRGARPLEIGIGLASGEIAAGPVGSPSRMDYTVIGDTVNLAARLQGANPHYGTTILLAGTTVARLASSVRLRPIDLVRVKGKETPTEIFEVLDHHTAATFPGIDDTLLHYGDGITRYRAGDWTGALAAFSAALKICPNDGPSWVYADRCLYYRDHPPAENWDGVWNLLTK